MAYTSGYLLVFGSVIDRGRPRRPRRRLSPPSRARPFRVCALRRALATVVSLPVYIPYHRVACDQGMVRSLANVAEYSATLKVISAPRRGRIHFST